MLPFDYILPRVQDASKWKSVGPDKSNPARHLQKLFDLNIEGGQAYARELAKLKKEGHTFRLTEGKVYELFDSPETIKVPIRLQVIEGVITWYFQTEHDVTHQEFRDEVYKSAALAHIKVEKACEKYLRGTNAFHVKKMHANEEESGLNHNHYRLMEGIDVDPKLFKKHLMGFVEAERKQNLVTADGKEKFLDEKEAKEIIRQYKINWAKITHKGPEKTVVVGGETLKLPKRDKSELEVYKEERQARWDEKDRKEWEKYKDFEVPCKTINADAPFEEQLEAAEKGMRGLFSERAHRRQMPGSKYKVIKTRYKMDDAVVSKLAEKKGKTPPVEDKGEEKKA